MSNVIRIEMARHGMKQKDLADLLGVSQQIVSKILNGTRELKLSEAKKLHDALDIPLKELIV